MEKIKKKKEKKIQDTKMIRLNLLFFVVFLLFIVLISRLAIVQIVDGEKYSKEANATIQKVIKTSSPRGKIYDRNNRTIVDNESTYSIVYSKEEKTTQEEMLEIAKKLSKMISLKTNKLTERDLKDYWILTRPEKAVKKLNKTEIQDDTKSDQE
ncbi:penicillin-binding protein, partial [Bacillus sp. JJ722]